MLAKINKKAHRGARLETSVSMRTPQGKPKSLKSLWHPYLGVSHILQPLT